MESRRPSANASTSSRDSPPARNLRDEVGADQAMEFNEKRIVEGGVYELAVFDTSFQRQNVACQVRRELGIA